MLLALLIAAGALRVTAQGCETFHVYWNNGGSFCTVDVARYLISPAIETVTGKSSCLPGANYSAWNQGVWPYITGAGVAIAGGVPQAANLSLHLATVRSTIQYLVPDYAAFDGNVVIDMEYWRPTAVGLAPAYMNLSIALVRAAHPTWNDSAIEAEAVRAFEAAALDFMEATLLTYAELMPHARIGYYGYPANYYYPCARGDAECGYNDPAAGPGYRTINDAQARIFAASSAVFPSVYLPKGTNASRYFPHHAEYVANTTAEAVRLRDAHARPGTPVLPFAWNFYHDGRELLLAADMAMVLQAPSAAGADGVVLWGAPDFYNESAPALAYLNSTLGPLARDAVTDSCACAAQRCSGHGACTPQGGCRCMPGFSGPSCAAEASLPAPIDAL